MKCDVDVRKDLCGNVVLSGGPSCLQVMLPWLLCNIVHFDNEIDLAGLGDFPCIKCEMVKPQVDRSCILTMRLTWLVWRIYIASSARTIMVKIEDGH